MDKRAKSLSSPTTSSSMDETESRKRRRSSSSDDRRQHVGKWFQVIRDCYQSLQDDRNHRQKVKLLRASKGDLVRVIDCIFCDPGGEIVDVETRTGYKAHIKKKDLDFENPFTINCLICTHNGKTADMDNKHEDLVDHLLHDHMSDFVYPLIRLQKTSRTYSCPLGANNLKSQCKMFKTESSSRMIEHILDPTGNHINIFLNTLLSLFATTKVQLPYLQENDEPTSSSSHCKKSKVDSDELEDLQERIEALKKDKANLKTNFNESNYECNRLKKLVDSQISKISEKDAQISSLTDRIAQLEKKLGSDQDNLKEEIDSFRSLIMKTRQSNQELESKNVELGEKNSELEKQIKRFCHSINNEQKKSADFEQKLKTAEKENKSLIELGEENEKILNEEIDSLKLQCSSLTKEKDKMKEDSAQKQNKLIADFKKSKNIDLEKAVKELTSKHSNQTNELNKRISKLEDHLKKEKKTRDQLKKDLENMKQTVIEKDNSTETLQSVRAKLKELEDKNSEQETNYQEKIKQAQEQMSSKCAEMQNELKNLKSESDKEKEELLERITKINEKHKIEKAELEKKVTVATENCKVVPGPSKNDPHDAAFVAKLKKELVQKRDENQSVVSTNVSLTKKNNELEAQVNSLSNKLKRSNSLIKLREQEIKILRDPEDDVKDEEDAKNGPDVFEVKKEPPQH